MTDSRSSASNKCRFVHKIASIFNIGILQLTVTDCKQLNGLIVCSYDTRLYLRRHNLPADEDFIYPHQIIKDCGKYFSEYERQFLEACEVFNNAIKSYKTGTLVSKITDGRKILIVVKNNEDQSQVLMFEFNEVNFVGLMKKYKNPVEVRKMIKDLFLIRD